MRIKETKQRPIRGVTTCSFLAALGRRGLPTLGKRHDLSVSLCRIRIVLPSTFVSCYAAHYALQIASSAEDRLSVTWRWVPLPELQLFLPAACPGR